MFETKSSGHLPICVEIMSPIQKHKLVIKVAYFSVSKLRISFKGIKSSGKLPISVNILCISQKQKRKCILVCIKHQIA